MVHEVEARRYLWDQRLLLCLFSEISRNSLNTRKQRLWNNEGLTKMQEWVISIRNISN